MERRGLNVDTAAIEAAVREMNLLESWEASFTVDADAGAGDECGDAGKGDNAEAE